MIFTNCLSSPNRIIRLYLYGGFVYIDMSTKLVDLPSRVYGMQYEIKKSVFQLKHKHITNWENR